MPGDLAPVDARSGSTRSGNNVRPRSSATRRAWRARRLGACRLGACRLGAKWAALAIALGALVGVASSALAQSGLVPEPTARRIGLTRAWHTRAAVNMSFDQIKHITLDGPTLFVQTSGALLQSIDAETGRTLWTATVGKANMTTLSPGASTMHVAAINGSTLYVLDRATGAIEWSRRLRSAPGAGPVVTKTHVLVPMVTGMIEGYELAGRGEKPPWIYQSFGRIFNQPVISNETISWTTDKGNLYIATASPTVLRGRLQTRSAIESRPAYWTPCFFACSLDGYLYAVHEKKAHTLWRFSAGEPIREPPIAVEGRVYVVPQFAGMYCLDAEHGSELWTAPGINQFVAQSKARVYAVDKLNQLAILDAATGARLGSMPLDPGLMKMRNERTDRIYLYSDAGLIECLHESAASQPMVHQPPPSESSDPTAPAPKAEKKAAAGEDGAEAPKDGEMKEGEMKADDAAGDAMKADGDAMGDDKDKKPAKKEDSPF